jgi:hypothetical protein
MVDDGLNVLDCPQLDCPPLEGRLLESPSHEGSEPGTTRFVARMRHDRGQLARVASTLNNFAVRRLTYVSTDVGTATVEVVVHVRDAARVESKLRRMVQVLDVSPN